MALLSLAGLAAIVLAGFAWVRWQYAQSSDDLLDKMRRIHLHASRAEVTRILGPPDYTIEAPEFPPWLEASAIGHVQRGTVLIYTIKRMGPKLLIIYLLPDSGVQFVTWEPT